MMQQKKKKKPKKPSARLEALKGKNILNVEVKYNGKTMSKRKSGSEAINLKFTRLPMPNMYASAVCSGKVTPGGKRKNEFAQVMMERQVNNGKKDVLKESSKA